MVDLTLEQWIARGTIPFDISSRESFDAAVDRMMEAVEAPLLGRGEPTHGVEGFLKLRNRLFERLVEVHGFVAIAIESSFPRGRLVNGYINGSEMTPDEVFARGFSHGFGQSAANRELIEWMKRYNADAAEGKKLRFYGFDAPTEMMYADSPRQMLHFVLDYLEANGANGDQRLCIDERIGDDASWENQAAAFDPSKSIGTSAAATALRIETEEMISWLGLRRPELEAKDSRAFTQALHYAMQARQLLTYHAAMATASEDRTVKLLGIRDLMMADNLVHIAMREIKSGRVLAFAHNTHLQRGKARWQWGAQSLEWWPAGAHVSQMMGSRYAVIGTGVGRSGAMGIGEPEAGTLESRLLATPGPARFIATGRGTGLAAEEIAALPVRAGTSQYFPLTKQSITDFDWLAVMDEM